MRLNDTSISSFIDATRIGILARINECVYNNLTCMFHHHYKKNCKSDYTINSIKGAKHQSIQQIVNITSNIALLRRAPIECTHVFHISLFTAKITQDKLQQFYQN